MKRDIKKEKGIIISVAVIILIIILIFMGIRFGVFSGKVIQEEEKETVAYQMYKQICSKDRAYFEEIAEWAGGNINEKIREVKAKSSYCNTGETEIVDEDKVEDMSCQCVEYERRKCEDGWTLKQNMCWKGNLFTNSLKTCSFYRCKDNHYVVVVEL